MSLFVVGTDTEVGKTVVSAMMLARFGAEYPLAYWKPVATGATEGRDTATVRELAGSFGEIHDETYLYRPPVSPHLAARTAKKPIEVEVLLDRLFQMRRRDNERHLIVEGIGGVLVPLDDNGTVVADFVRTSKLPCVVVARSTLGTINHTLLTLEALRRRHIPIAGVILNGPRNPSNRQAIERFGDVRVIAQLEPLEPLSERSLVHAAADFDRRARLRRWLGA
jgi:dethiobiotin synthetase/malonyl-CoA O-methyltransferase